jgi:hypothetical protein
MEKSGEALKAEINRNHPLWPAACQMALILGYSPVITQRDAASSDAWRLFWRSVKDHPILGLARGWLALEMYWECGCYIKYVHHQAEAVRKPETQELVEKIITHSMEDLSRSVRGAWGELSGLAVQKLRHIGYYEDVLDYAAAALPGIAEDDPGESEIIG